MVELSVVVRVVVGSSPIGRPIAPSFLCVIIVTYFPVSLFTKLMRQAPFQPATNLWRAVELTFLIDKAFPLLKNARHCLDLGCGDGQIMALLRGALPDDLVLTGIDIDPLETKLAKQTNLYHEVHCTGGNSLPLEDASQDFMISNSVLEHVAPIHEVLGESSRVLKQEGLFIATVPSDQFHACLNGSWLPNVSKEKYNKHIDKRLAHLRYWSEDEWTKALGKVGIELTHCLPYLSKQETQRWEFISRLTGGLFYALRGGKSQPITIQRSMGMRQGGKMPSWIASLIARACVVGLCEGNNAEYGCVLVIGRKK